MLAAVERCVKLDHAAECTPDGAATATPDRCGTGGRFHGYPIDEWYANGSLGLEQGFNDMAAARAIVMHGAAYVSKEAVRVLGRLGRSWGCPAVRSEIADNIIDTIRGGSAIFAYYPEKDWLTNSAFVHH